MVNLERLNWVKLYFKERIRIWFWMAVSLALCLTQILFFQVQSALFILSLLAVFTYLIAARILDDVFDLELDSVLNPGRVLVSKKRTSLPSDLVFLAFVIFVISIVIAGICGRDVLIRFALSSMIVSFLYLVLLFTKRSKLLDSLKLLKYPLLGYSVSKIWASSGLGEDSVHIYFCFLILSFFALILDSMPRLSAELFFGVRRAEFFKFLKLGFKNLGVAVVFVFVLTRVRFFLE